MASDCSAPTAGLQQTCLWVLGLGVGEEHVNLSQEPWLNRVVIIPAPAYIF